MTQMVTTLLISFRTPLYIRINMVLGIFHFCIVSIHLFNDPILTHVPG